MIKMRKLLIYSVLIFLFLKVSASNADTIKHTLGGCIAEDCMDIPEEFNFHFIGDTLVFSGKIFANSCGEHFLICSIDSDTINFNRLDTRELCRCHCLYNFEAKIPGCHSSQYRVILSEYFDDGLDTTIIRSFSSGPDTIQHTLGSCISENCEEIPEEFYFSFIGDTLVFSGKIFANSCGEHFLICSIDSDTIHFNRLDTGEGCFCHCLYDFIAKIPGCHLNKYRVILTEYFDNGLDTIIYKNALGISKQSWIKDNVKISPNPFNSVTTIEINSATELIGSILIYDYLGRIVRNEKSINSKEYEFYRMNLNDGIYFYLINTNINNLYTGRIIVK